MSSMTDNLWQSTSAARSCWQYRYEVVTPFTASAELLNGARGVVMILGRANDAVHASPATAPVSR